MNCPTREESEGNAAEPKSCCIPANCDGVLSLERADLLGPDDQTCVVEDSDEEDTDVDEGKTTGIPENDGREQGGFKRHACLPEATSC